MKILFVLNDPPYGTERCYNGLRLARALCRRPEREVRVFLMADAISCAKAGQTVPKGYYNLERMLQAVTSAGGEVAACGSCMDARGLAEQELAAGVRRGTLEELADWTDAADRVLVF